MGTHEVTFEASDLWGVVWPVYNYYIDHRLAELGREAVDNEAAHYCKLEIVGRDPQLVTAWHVATSYDIPDQPDTVTGAVFVLTNVRGHGFPEVQGHLYAVFVRQPDGTFDDGTVFTSHTGPNGTYQEDMLDGLRAIGALS